MAQFIVSGFVGFLFAHKFPISGMGLEYHSRIENLGVAACRA